MLLEIVRAPAGEAPDASEAPIGVLVVDDQELFRGVLREVVAATPGMTLVGEAASGEAALRAVEALAPRLVIIDKRMPGIGGVEAARLIRAARPEIVVVLVSAETPRADLVETSGAVAFLHKKELSPRTLTQVWESYGAG